MLTIILIVILIIILVLKMIVANRMLKTMEDITEIRKILNEDSARINGDLKMVLAHMISAYTNINNKYKETGDERSENTIPRG